MLEYLAEKMANPAYLTAASAIEDAIWRGFEEGQLRPAEFGGEMGTQAITRAVIEQLRATDQA